LLLAAVVLWLLYDGKEEVALNSQEEPAAKMSERICVDKGDCAIGEDCTGHVCVNPLLSTPAMSNPKIDIPHEEAISDAGWATIIVAIMGGLTGLLGAVTHTIIAFLEVKERKRMR